LKEKAFASTCAAGAGRRSIIKPEGQAHAGEDDFQVCGMANAAHALLPSDLGLCLMGTGRIGPDIFLVLHYFRL
jgi:hypothetical protein